MLFVIIYIWSRKDPHRPTIFYGFTFQQWHTPFLLIAFTLLLRGDLRLPLLGIVVGHAYYFLSDVVPRVYGKHPLRTPRIWTENVTFYLQQWGIGTGIAAAGGAAGGGAAFRAPGQVQPPPPPRQAWMRGPGHRLDQ